MTQGLKQRAPTLYRLQKLRPGPATKPTLNISLEILATHLPKGYLKFTIQNLQTIALTKAHTNTILVTQI